LRGLLGGAARELQLSIAGGLLNCLSLQSGLSCCFKPGLLGSEIRLPRFFLCAGGLDLALRFGFLPGTQPFLFDCLFNALASFLSCLRARCGKVAVLCAVQIRPGI